MGSSVRLVTFPCLLGVATSLAATTSRPLQELLELLFYSSELAIGRGHGPNHNPGIPIRRDRNADGLDSPLSQAPLENKKILPPVGFIVTATNDSSIRNDQGEAATFAQLAGALKHGSGDTGMR